MTGFTLPTSRRITQVWGAEFDDWDGDGDVDYPGGFYNSIGWDGHNGIDYGCGLGDPIEAVADGIVVWAAWAGNHWLLSGGGNAVLIEHPEYGVQTEYLHLSRFAVKNGARVKKGQVVGYAGKTGAATGYHLHLGMLPLKGINLNNRARGRIDPTPWLYGNLNPDYAGSAAIAPQGTTTPTPEKESEMPASKRVDSKFNTRHRLPKGKAYMLSVADDGKSANFAVGGPGHYVINNHVRGEGLLAGQKITARFLLTKDGKSSGHHEQDIVGSIDGKFKQPLVLNRGVEPGTVITCELTSVNTETAYVTGFGAEVATWKA